MTQVCQTSAAADSGMSPTKPHIPSPEELLEETPLIYTSNYDTPDLIKFCVEQLAVHKKTIRIGTPLCIMVSERASTDDLDLVCRQFWSAGWRVSYLPCEGRPHRMFFSRPRYRGTQFRNGSTDI